MSHELPSLARTGLKTSRVGSCELAWLRTRSRSDPRPRRRAACFRTGDEGQSGNREASKGEVTVESSTRRRRLPQPTNRNTPPAILLWVVWDDPGTHICQRRITRGFGLKLLINQNLFLRKCLSLFPGRNATPHHIKSTYFYMNVSHLSSLGMVHSAGESATDQSAHAIARLANHRRQFDQETLKRENLTKLNSNSAFKNLILPTCTPHREPSRRTPAVADPKAFLGFLYQVLASEAHILV